MPMFAALFLPDQMLLIRILAAFLTALAAVLACGGRFIAFLHGCQGLGQPIRENGPQSHLLTKKGTPTMGGILILAAIIVSSLLWCSLSNLFVWLCLAVILVFGATGFADDYVKVKKHTPDAMTAKMKLLLQFVTAFAVVWLVIADTSENLRFSLVFPYVNRIFDLWWFYLPFAMVVIAGTSNAVNLSDGLDGLAGGLCLTAFSAFGVIAFTTAFPETVNFRSILIPQCGEVAVVCAAAAGACLGFLWFNSSPAKVFMGDTGSLALGALLGTVAVMTKHEILLAVIGFVFVAEALSVMIQVFWYKRTKKRVFLMAPIHHHFEQLGWKETTVVARFRIVAIVCTVIGLFSLIF